MSKVISMSVEEYIATQMMGDVEPMPTPKRVEAKSISTPEDYKKASKILSKYNF